MKNTAKLAVRLKQHKQQRDFKLLFVPVSKQRGGQPFIHTSCSNMSMFRFVAQHPRNTNIIIIRMKEIPLLCNSQTINFF